MYEWKVSYSKTERKGNRISCECWSATVYADDEVEVRKIMAEENPGMDIDKMVRGKHVDDA